MKYRHLGGTGISVSEVGFGTWGIGGVTDDGANSYGKTDDVISKEALLKAVELGINFFDTSNIYGYGHAEELLGEIFEKKRDRVVIASKVGFVKHGGPHNLEPSYVRGELEKTLKRLKTDYLDLYQVHSAPIEIFKTNPEYVEIFRELKKEGKIRAFGYSVKNPNEGLTAIQDFGFETVQVNFNLIDERAIENGLLDLAEKNQIGIIARTPFCFGFLTDSITNFDFPKEDHRSTWSKAQLELWARAPKSFAFLRENKNWTAAQLALKFCLSFKAVSTVIPGILTPREAEENASVSGLEELTPSEVEKAIEVHKENNFFDHSLVKK